MSGDNHSQAIGPVPTPGGEDLVDTTWRTVVAAIPGVGSPLIQLLEVIETPVMHRRTQWLNQLADALNALQAQVEGFEVGQLGDRPDFQCALMHAARASDRTHRQEKLDALRNAVLNVAVGNYDDDVATALIGDIDDLTPTHVAVLAYYADSGAWHSENTSDIAVGLTEQQVKELQLPEDTLAYLLPQLEYRIDLYIAFRNELERRGFLVLRHRADLVAEPNPVEFTVGTADNVRIGYTTMYVVSDFGQEFLTFLSAPTTEVPEA